MSKYIEADKLKAELKKLSESDNPIEYSSMEKSAYNCALYDVEYLITSLQQEQPQVADDSKMEQSEGYLEYWLEQFGMPKENIENCATQIAQGYGACRYLEGVQHGAEAVSELAEQESEFPVTDEEMEAFLASHPKVEVPEKYKTPDWLYKELEQEPEVELEKEINHFWDSCIKHKNERGGNVIWSNKLEVEVLARHFNELGNRALEEAARHVYESWMGGTMDDVRRDMVELGRAINARKEN